MRQSSIGDRLAALVPTDNYSVADTSFDDQTKKKTSSRETSPVIKHKSLPAEAGTNENWRPHVSTVTETSTGSTDLADFMSDAPPPPPKTNNFAPRRSRRPGASHGAEALASLKARLVSEHNTSDISSAALTINSETGDQSLIKPLESGSDYEVTKEAYFRSVAELPQCFAPDPELVEENKSAGKSTNHSAMRDANMDFSIPSQSHLPPHASLQGQPQTTEPRECEASSQSSLENHPSMPFLTPTLQEIVRKNLRPERGQKGREVAEFILRFLAWPKKVAPFAFPSRSRLPTYGNIRPSSPKPKPKTVSGDDDDLEYAKGTDGGFSFSHGVPARLPLHMISGAEARLMEIKANRRSAQMDKLEHTEEATDSFGFELHPGTKLPSFSSFFKGPIETSTLRTQLASKDAPLHIPEVRKKGNVVGSIDSVGEYIRPNADPRFLFSITPFTKSELQRGKMAKDVLFGKLERTWRKPLSVDEKTQSSQPSQSNSTSRSSISSRTNRTTRTANGTNETTGTTVTTETFARQGTLRGGEGPVPLNSRSTDRGSSSTASASTVSMSSSVSTVPSSVSSSKVDPGRHPSYRAPPPTRVESSVDVDAGESPTGDRHRFDALVNRLQQKLSEQSDQGSKATAKSEIRSDLVVHGSNQQDHSHVSESSRASSSSFTEKQKERLLASTASFASSKLREVESNIKGASGPDGGPHTEPQPPPLPPRPQAKQSTGEPNLPSVDTRRGKSTSELDPNRPPFQPSNIQPAFVHPSYSGQQAMVPEMAAHPGYWQPNLQHGPSPPGTALTQVPAPFIAALMPPVYAVNAGTAVNTAANTMTNSMPRWPISKRPNNRRHDLTPFVPISASEQQKIEEHIELLKATIPNYATLSKRRQELRTGKQNGNWKGKGKGSRYQKNGASSPWTDSRQWQQGQPQLQHQQKQQQQLFQPHVPRVQLQEPAHALQQMQLHQLQQMQQQMNQMHLAQQNQQLYQLDHAAQPALPGKTMQSMQPMQHTQHMQLIHPYSLYNPSSAGVPTWSMPMMNMNM